MPIPSPMSRKSSRCSGVASRSRGNHASGTSNFRPSWSATRITPPANSTDFARGCSGAKAIIPEICHHHRLQPILHDTSASFHVHMGRFPSLVAEEEHAEPRTPQHGWHVWASATAARSCSRQRHTPRPKPTSPPYAASPKPTSTAASPTSACPARARSRVLAPADGHEHRIRRVVLGRHREECEEVAAP